MPQFSNDLILGHDPHGGAVILPKSVRSRHCFCIGATGVGKSKQIQSLIQQDLLAWPKTRSGIALFDPHGVVVSNLLTFACEHRLDHLPIVPYDCRRLDWLISFNPLRARKGIEPATVISGCIDSLLHAWGTFGDQANAMPRLEKWLRTILLTVFLSGGTLGDSLALLRSPDLRRAMTHQLQDDVARTVWASAASLKESEFVSCTESLLNRIQRFVSATMLRLSLNQTGVSLDFSSILEKGGIVLISLATAGGAIDEVDARTLGSLLLQDLWTSARLRGKGEAGQKRPFRVYLDEFQKYLTPMMAEGLAEARGFGLEMFFACQSTTQMCATPAGQQVLDAVLANAQTKIVFNIQHPDDLDLITPWLYRNEVNPDLVKHQHHSTKVLDHEIKYLQSTSRSATKGSSTSTNWSTTESKGNSVSSGVSRSSARTATTSRGHGHSAGRTQSRSSSEEAGTGQSVAESAAEGATVSQGTDHSRGSTRNKSESKHLDGEYDDLKKIVGPEPQATFDEAYTDEDEEHRPLRRSIDRSASEGESEGISESEGIANTRSKSRAQATQSTTSRSHGISDAESCADSSSLTQGESSTAGETVSATESTISSTAETTGGSETLSEATTEGHTLSPMLMPKIGKEASPPIFAAVEEQMFRFSQLLSALPDRQAVVRTGSAPPVAITTPTVMPAGISEKGARAWATLRLKRLPFALRREDAAKRLEVRQRALEMKFLSPPTDEPKTFVRRVKR